MYAVIMIPALSGSIVVDEKYGCCCLLSGRVVESFEALKDGI